MDCIFCNIDKTKLENTIIDETNNFLVLPAVGSLVEGYLLIISKRHLNSMAELTKEEKEEYQFLINKYHTLFKVVRSKIEELRTLNYLLENTNDDKEKLLLKALIHSNKVMVEDIMREAGYMLPQSTNSNKFLNYLLNKEDDLDKTIINKLLEKLEVND